MPGPRRCTAGWGRTRGSTHTLDHHGATPIGGLGPGYLLHVMDHHGADTVCVSIAAVGERKVRRPSRPCLPPKCHPNATGSRRELEDWRLQCLLEHDALSPHPAAPAPCPALGEGWPHRGT